MTTTLNVSLSPTLQTELGQKGVWAYAVYYDINGDNPTWTNLVIDGAIEGSGTVAITLPNPFMSGKIYFIIQSPASNSNLPNQLTTESTVNWDYASNYDFRYDSLEITLQNSPSDVCNLTSINGFGLPIGVSTNGLAVGYNISAATLVEDIQNINPSNTYTYDYNAGQLSGNFRMALSPTEAIGQSIPVFQPSDWAQYVQSLETSSATDIVLTGLFNGAVDATNVWHNGGYFAYQLQVESTDVGSVFWLVPLPSSQIQGAIQVTPDNLENSIYSTLGNVNIYQNMGDERPFLPDMNTGENNQWGKVLSEFLIGFTAGFYNMTGQSLNSQVTTPIDLNQNINWDPIYAFGQNLQSTPPSYQASDPYSQIFYQNSNSYGSGYSDALMSQYAVGGPQISVFDQQTQSNVAVINLTIFADSDSPSADYTQPEIFNYIDPGTNGYQVPTANTTGLNIVLYLAAAVNNTAGVVLDSTSTITLNIATSYTNGAPVWNTVTFDGASAGDYGLWQIWEISYSNGVYSAAPSSSPVQQSVGSMLINFFPIPSATNAIGWYQIQIGSKTYNLYTTTINSQFANPGYSSADQQGSLAIDGLATITPPNSPSDQSIGTFTIVFAGGDTVAIDPSLLNPNTAANFNVQFPVAPSCPVAGKVSEVGFEALDHQDNLASNTITTNETNIAFAWTGKNKSPNTASWISGYTNKIDAETVALITITPQSGSAFIATAVADIDGQWQTGHVPFLPGMYTVTMTEYLASDTEFAHPMTPPSSVLTLYVTGVFE